MRTAKKGEGSVYSKFFLLGILLLILPVSIKIYTNSKIVLKDSSLDGSEAIEIEQNTIPADVQQYVDQQRKVLGETTAGSPQGTSTGPSVRVPILMYHYVEYVKDAGDKIRISLNTTPYTLEQEVSTLSHAGYTFMTSVELTDVLDGKGKLPPKPIVLTFDDGYRDFYTDAYPILKKYHAKATQYAIAGFLDRPNHLLTSQLQEIANDGLVEIGAHTVHHVWLKGQSAVTVRSEVIQSKQMLENLVHKAVISFAYPFGAFDVQAVATVEQAGFRSATSTIPGIDQPQTNRYFLYRLRPGGRTGKNLLAWLDTIKNN